MYVFVSKRAIVANLRNKLGYYYSIQATMAPKINFKWPPRWLPRYDSNIIANNCVQNVQYIGGYKIYVSLVCGP